jgi:hypothetical protein
MRPHHSNESLLSVDFLDILKHSVWAIDSVFRVMVFLWPLTKLRYREGLFACIQNVKSALIATGGAGKR